MSLYIDLKYLLMLSPRLARFKKKSDNLYNCRCPICGDSTTNTTKARGYFYKQRTDLFYKCHNCQVSKHFGTFLKEFDSELYKTYVFERYAKAPAEKKSHSNVTSKKVVKFTEPFSPARQFERLAQRLSSLPKTHPAVAYCHSRGITEKKKLDSLYVISINDVIELAPRYKDRLAKGPPRLAIPFYDLKGNLTGLTLRTIQDEALRYIAIKLEEDGDVPLIFGLQNMDPDRTVYVVEGALDSLFLPNSIACNGTSFQKIEQLKLTKDKVVVVIDNQPRNKDVCKVYEKYIALGYKVCIWPALLGPKDLNEMAQEGYNIPQLVKSCVKQGLAAQVAFTQWRKC